MKSERRHDLETNELAVQMQDLLDRIKPYATPIALVLAGLIALAYLGSIWGSATSRNDQDAWDEYTLASYSSDPELSSMKLLAENDAFSGTPVPEWAFLAWADRQLLLASQTYLTDRATTNKRLDPIEGVFKNLATDATNPQIQDRARFGLAQTLEMLGKIDEAREAYGRVKGDLATLANDRAEQLESGDVQAACKWLATAELPKRETPSTSGAIGGTKPAFSADVPAPMPNNNPLNDTRSIQDILTSETGGSTDENRYGEQENADTGETPAEQAEQEDAAVSVPDDTDKPVSDAEQ